MPRDQRSWIKSAAFSIALLALVTLSISNVVDWFFLLMIGAVGVSVGLINLLFSGSRFFSLSLANFLAVYACVFSFFVDANFQGVDIWARHLGFALPIVAFLIGTAARRSQIQSIVSARSLREEQHLGRIFQWLVPIAVIGAATFVLRALELDPAYDDVGFLSAMAAIALVAGLVSRDIALFLLDAGLLFERFFSGIARLVVPAFAFFTFYSLIVIVYAAIYRLIDRISEPHHFLVQGVARDITFAESLYFSIVTLSTVGFGDIVPITDLIRLIVASEIVSGALLLLFGLSEILDYARREREDRRDDDER
jgi:voltage-gated potassium channel